MAGVDPGFPIGTDPFGGVTKNKILPNFSKKMPEIEKNLGCRLVMHQCTYNVLTKDTEHKSMVKHKRRIHSIASY